jgi:hypothetical protein
MQPSGAEPQSFRNPRYPCSRYGVQFGVDTATGVVPSERSMPDTTEPGPPSTSQACSSVAWIAPMGFCASKVRPLSQIILYVPCWESSWQSSAIKRSLSQFLMGPWETLGTAPAGECISCTQLALGLDPDHVEFGNMREAPKPCARLPPARVRSSCGLVNPGHGESDWLQTRISAPDAQTQVAACTRSSHALWMGRTRWIPALSQLHFVFETGPWHGIPP